MVALMSFRVEVAPDLDVVWEDDRPPSLAFLLEDDEHERLCQAGAPEAWECAYVSLPSLIDFLFDKRSRTHGKGNFSCEFSRRVPDRSIVMRVSFKGRPFMERAYGEDICHAAIRLCGHARAFSELCEAVVRQPGRAFKDELFKVIRKDVAEPTAKKSSIEPMHVGAPVTSEMPPHPSAVVVRRSVRVPAGPLNSTQVRLFAKGLGNGGALPETLSAPAKEQITAYAKMAGIVPPSAD